MRKVTLNMGDKHGLFAIKFKVPRVVDGKIVKNLRGESVLDEYKTSFRNVILGFPADSETLADWHKSKEFKTEATDGTKVVFSGIEAAAASKCSHDFESLRGKAREKLIALVESGKTPDEASAIVGPWLRKRAVEFWPGKDVVEVVKPVVLDMTVLGAFYAAGDTAGAAAYVASMGGTVLKTEEPTEPTEEEKLAAAQAELAAAADAKILAAEESDEDLDDNQEEVE